MGFTWGFAVLLHSFHVIWIFDFRRLSRRFGGRGTRRPGAQLRSFSARLVSDGGFLGWKKQRMAGAVADVMVSNGLNFGRVVLAFGVQDV